MLISDVSQEIGVWRKNIAFYEAEGMLGDSRDVNNPDRTFTKKDVRKLQEIVLLRKLGISVADIPKIHTGEMSLHECLDKYIAVYHLQADILRRVIELCEEIKTAYSRLSDIDVELCMRKIAAQEKQGAPYTNISEDFKMKTHPKFLFEAADSVKNITDLVNEIEIYADWKKKPLVFRSMGANPKVLLDGKKYICFLKKPSNVLPISGLYYGAIALGALKNIYFYEDYESIDIAE